jgi:hypothetical protein
MFNKSANLIIVCALTELIALTAGKVQANWLDTFDSGSFDLATWQFDCYPDLTKTFEATIRAGTDANDYLTLDETSPAEAGGSQFGVGIGNPEDKFTDVRVGAYFNITGDASWNYHGLAARLSYFKDDGSITGYPGIVANCYVMLIHYEEGPANLKVELLKAVNLSDDIMAEYQPEVPVPGLDHAQSHYFELDVVGADPVYITGSVYEYKGGPLISELQHLSTPAPTTPGRPRTFTTMCSRAASAAFSRCGETRSRQAFTVLLTMYHPPRTARRRSIQARLMGRLMYPSM